MRAPVGVRVLELGALLAAYPYLGYPLVLALTSALVPERQPHPLSSQLPTMTVVIPAFNEQEVIINKLDDTLGQDYPPEKLEVIVVADGSSDATAELARDRGVRVLWAPQRQGKSSAVNRGVMISRGDLVCLTDANCSLAPGSLRALAHPFCDPRVAVVSGAKTVSPGSGTAGDSGGRGEGLYWRFESILKRWESQLGCAMGAPGELCAVRRSAFRPIPPDVINDDYHITCDALARGLAVRYCERAVAHELVSPTIAEELERRTRVAAGTWQTTLGHLVLCDPKRLPVAIAFISHRLIRSIVVPPILPILLVLSARYACLNRVARFMLTGQLCWYLAALMGAYWDEPILAGPFQFSLVNLATLKGAWRHLTGRQPVQWRRVRRAAWAGA